MTISYNWLSDYLPLQIDPHDLGKILTSVGLEVESINETHNIKGGLKDLVAGEVLECKPHPNADKLKLTRVDIGAGEQPLQIVCGANNVEKGQKVIVAKPGVTIYPIKGEPVTLRIATIRGVESYGMICAEDEIGIGHDHAGIIVLPSATKTGTAVANLFQIETDYSYEIGLTPNRMDAMSHLGVAKDVCAYLTHHENKPYKPKSPFTDSFTVDNTNEKFSIEIENKDACRRYSGISISNVTVGESPQWLQQRLKSIGQRPINNIVDITNFILHETGQPLHAFDAEKIKHKRIIVKNLQSGTPFTTLDQKERKLEQEDLMICNGAQEPMCIAGVFGGVTSGVTAQTKHIFLESAWFNPIDIRKTSFRHGLRTDAAMRFEKNIDISNTVVVLKRAATLIKKMAGGSISSDVIDVYPAVQKRTEVKLQYAFLRKLSGKFYPVEKVKSILTSLGFEIAKESEAELTVLVPFNKPDITLPADLIEEVMRIDGYDNIDIPAAITITPAVGYSSSNSYKEKLSGYLIGLGFNEIFTNSITNAAYFTPEELKGGVRLVNNLSAVHNLMRPGMLETGLEAIGYNLNRKADQLLFFEFGKTYSSPAVGEYLETEHLCIYITGHQKLNSWKEKSTLFDFFYLKGVVEKLLSAAGIDGIKFEALNDHRFSHSYTIRSENETIAETGVVHKKVLSRFDVKQDVFFADINWDALICRATKKQIMYKELPRQLPVNRDLALIVPRSLPYSRVEESIKSIQLEKLQDIALFDVFESDKLGVDKKSFAVSFRFLDETKTLTDKEIDIMMQAIMRQLEKDLKAEIRKQ